MNYNRLMIWWPLFFLTQLSADTQAVEKYCFSSPSRMENAYSQLLPITLPTDEVHKQNNCILVTTELHRRELIQRYLRSIDSTLRVNFSSLEIKRDPCLLKIEKIKVSQAEKQSGELSNRPYFEVSNSQGKASEVFHVKTFKDFHLSVDQDAIQGECRFITPDRYEITLRVRKEAKPLTPPIPAGSVVIVTTPPPDQKTMNLETQLQLQRGNKVEIGSIVIKLKDDSHKIDATKKAEMKKENNNAVEKVFLSLD
jgi:hypothetical protein